jgi:hypothetical protein
VNLPLIGANEWTDSTAVRVEELLQAARRVASTVREIVGSGESRDPLEDVPSWPSPVSAR